MRTARRWVMSAAAFRSGALLLIALCLSVSYAAAQETATVVGVAVDPVGVAVGGARATLALVDGTEVQTSTADASGAFVLSHVVPGLYRVILSAPGFALLVTEPFEVTAQTTSYALPRSVLALAAASAYVTVRPTEAIAAEQIKAQEHQRLFGVVPSFYVSYVADAAPLSSQQKLSLALRETFDWTAFIGATLAAAADQSTHTPPGFGAGASGYGQRWLAAFADDRTGDLLDHFVYASVFRQDPRYFYQGTGTSTSRVVHAVTGAFVARRDAGGMMPNYSYLLGAFTAAALSNIYYPHSARHADVLLTNVAVGVAERAGANLFQEFVGKRFTRHVPNAGSAGSPR